ncbi:putative F420-0 ABC transporter substrate-binding protein [Oceanitalea stevensii]|uniref:F420-0 ABC transporter substrate-binding protein n=1 Tax=Oceanitalea stevensii TaxID=2763072 RepID=A0ABR8YXD4_9MICO|nr:putative F420-0 ABC transporter substrate-binding protein [Oceanitalea stevensii]MBD8060724.1 putative F420-0 ABC transporter substrate-binding protein [Oceanitalea stevensii]
MPLPRRAAVLGALALVLTACSAAPAEDATTGDDGGSAAPSSSAAGFPVTVTSCGTETTLDAPPERIVTIKSSATEMVIALGAGDRIVGTAFSDGPLPDGVTPPPVLAERNPSRESVLELAPDLVYAGWESNLSDDGAGERAGYEELGVSTFVSPSACQDPAHQPNPLTFEDVFAEIEEVGRVLGVPEEAETLVAEQRADLEAVTPTGEGLSALWYSSGSDTPFVGAGIGAPQMIMAAAGLTNVAADVEDTWTSLSWEAVADRDPDVLVLVDSAWNTAEHKIEVLESNPVTAAMPAVQEGRYLTVPFAATEAGVRNVSAVADLTRQIGELAP